MRVMHSSTLDQPAAAQGMSNSTLVPTPISSAIQSVCRLTQMAQDLREPLLSGSAISTGGVRDAEGFEGQRRADR